MSDWHLQAGEDQPTHSITGYAVYDALGVRLGYVSGLVLDGDGRTQMLKVTVTEWSDPTDYLIPIGAITLIGDTKSSVQLRDLTKQTIRRHCYQLDGDLPEKRLLMSLKRHFPAPRISVVERLARRKSDPIIKARSPVWVPLNEIPLT